MNQEEFHVHTSHAHNSAGHIQHTHTQTHHVPSVLCMRMMSVSSSRLQASFLISLLLWTVGCQRCSRLALLPPPPCMALAVDPRVWFLWLGAVAGRPEAARAPDTLEEEEEEEGAFCCCAAALIRCSAAEAACWFDPDISTQRTRTTHQCARTAGLSHGG